MSLHNLAQDLAARGRNGDSVLVHMTPGEVDGLQALAMAHGGSLSTNPETGLPEANFLKAILPMIAGGALTVASGGTLSPLMAAMIVGGGTAVATKDLGKGLMAGMGAFGGAGLAGGIAGLGAASAEGAASAITAPGTGAVSTAPGSQAAMLASQNAGFGQAGLNSLAQSAGGTAPSAGQVFDAGLHATTQNPQGALAAMGGEKAVGKMAMQAAAPVIMGAAEPPKAPQPVTEMPHPMLEDMSYSYDPSRRDRFAPGYADGGVLELFQEARKRREAQEAAMAPRAQAIETDPYYTMGGESGDAYKYLMGARATSPQVDAARAMPPTPATVTGAKYDGLPQYSFDTQTKQFTLLNKKEMDAAKGNAAAAAAANSASSAPGTWQGAAAGGLMGLAAGGRLLTGPGDGVSDSIPAKIDGERPARLATGEFVFDARTVSEIGNGDTRAGAKKLYAVMDAIHKTRAKAKRGEPSGADRHLKNLMA